MTDPLALDPVLPARQRSERPWNDDLPHDERYAHFEAHVAAGGEQTRHCADDRTRDEQPRASRQRARWPGFHLEKHLRSGVDDEREDRDAERAGERVEQARRAGDGR